MKPKATQIQRPFPLIAYSDRIGWERGVTDGGRAFKAGRRDFGFELKRETAYRAGYKHGMEIEHTKQRRAQ